MKEKIEVILFSLAILAIGLLFNSCGRSNSKQAKGGEQELSGRIALSGAFALYPLVVQWAEEFRKIHPDVKFEIECGGAGKGITDVLTNQVDIGMVSRELKREELAKGAETFVVARDAVVATINAANPYCADILKHGITAQQAQGIWGTGKITSWNQILGGQQNGRIAVFTRSDACGAAETFASWIGGHQEDLLGEGLHGDPGVATAVTKNVLAVGFNNIGYVFDSTTKKPLPGLRILPIDLNGNGTIDPEEDFYATRDQLAAAIADGRYPSPPAHDLYLVTRGTPTDPLVVAFLQFVLTKGQKANASAGYVAIPLEQLTKSLRKLGIKQ